MLPHPLNKPLYDYTVQPPILLEHKNNYIRVVATELHPRIQYKTLPITEYTTAFEVVVKLVTKFATNEEDKDRPDLFYLNEVCAWCSRGVLISCDQTLSSASSACSLYDIL